MPYNRKLHYVCIVYLYISTREVKRKIIYGTFNTIQSSHNCTNCMHTEGGRYLFYTTPKSILQNIYIMYLKKQEEEEED